LSPYLATLHVEGDGVAVDNLQVVAGIKHVAAGLEVTAVDEGALDLAGEAAALAVGQALEVGVVATAQCQRHCAGVLLRAAGLDLGDEWGWVRRELQCGRSCPRRLSSQAPRERGMTRPCTDEP
jgi:hypothetical protein